MCFSTELLGSGHRMPVQETVANALSKQLTRWKDLFQFLCLASACSEMGSRPRKVVWLV